MQKLEEHAERESLEEIQNGKAQRKYRTESLEETVQKAQRKHRTESLEETEQKAGRKYRTESLEETQREGLKETEDKKLKRKHRTVKLEGETKPESYIQSPKTKGIKSGGADESQVITNRITVNVDKK